MSRLGQDEKVLVKNKIGEHLSENSTGKLFIVGDLKSGKK